MKGGYGLGEISRNSKLSATRRIAALASRGQHQHRGFGRYPALPDLFN
jgi:hypothetical protein